VRWLLYAFGKGLPTEYRAAVQLSPFAVLLYLFVPGSAGIRATAVAGGLALGFFYALAYMYETTENRAIKAGYPRGTAREIRDRRSAGSREEEARRYAERYRNQPPSDG
jgi:Family of unknown function (DUF5313)